MTPERLLTEVGVGGQQNKTADQFRGLCPFRQSSTDISVNFLLSKSLELQLKDYRFAFVPA
jgi:hypothetical protein